MRLHRSLLVVATASAVSACIPRAAPPPAAQPPARPVPVPAATPAPPPAAKADWRDWPLTPGDWRYENGRASFGQGAAPLLALACDRGAQRVTMSVAGQGTAALTVRTSSTSRLVPVSPTGATLDALLPANDPLLDAIGFSRGRFVIERGASPALVVPAYPEILRLTEDCRG